MTQNQFSGFIQNPIYTNHIWYPTKFNVSNLVESSEIEFEASLTQNTIKCLGSYIGHLKHQNDTTTL